jgi:hypothetical protein
MLEPAIETLRLERTFPNGVQAIADLDLRVEHGEVFGYIGPNGRFCNHRKAPGRSLRSRSSSARPAASRSGRNTLLGKGHG